MIGVPLIWPTESGIGLKRELRPKEEIVERQQTLAIIQTRSAKVTDRMRHFPESTS